MQIKLWIVSLLAIAIGSTCASKAYANTYTVSTLDDGGDGSLRQILDDQASSGDVITFNPSLAGGTISFNPASDSLKINFDVTITTDGLASPITIDGYSSGGSTVPVLKIQSGTLNLRGINITNSGRDGIYLAASTSANLIQCDITYNNGMGINANQDGPGAARLTATNCSICNNANEAVYTYETSVNLSGCSILRNGPSKFGISTAAVYLTANPSANTINISNCTIEGNPGSNSTGIIITSDTFPAHVQNVYISDCTVNNNDYGGIYCNLTDARITNCNVFANSSSFDRFAGGITNCDGQLVIVNTTIDGNQGVRGGGILNYSYHSGNPETVYMRMTNCTVSNNTAQNNGGGFLAIIDYYGYWDVRLINCTFFNNQALNGHGGAISVEDGPLHPAVCYLLVQACTITKNHAYYNGSGTSGEGGGLSVLDSIYNHVTCDSSIIAANTADQQSPDVVGNIVNDYANQDSNYAGFYGYDLIGAMDGSSGWVNTDQTGTEEEPLDPGLDQLADNGGPTLTCALLASSPTLTTGDPNLPNSTFTMSDQRGVPRPPSGPIDVGSYQASGGAGPRAAAAQAPGNSAISHRLNGHIQINHLRQ